MATQITSAESCWKRRDKGAVYHSERLGSKLPISDEDFDTECGTSYERDCPLPPRRKKEEWLVCQNCETLYHWSCGETKSKKKLAQYYFCSNCKIIELVVVYEK